MTEIKYQVVKNDNVPAQIFADQGDAEAIARWDSSAYVVPVETIQGGVIVAQMRPFNPDTGAFAQYRWVLVKGSRLNQDEYVVAKLRDGLNEWDRGLYRLNWPNALREYERAIGNDMFGRMSESV